MGIEPTSSAWKADILTVIRIGQKRNTLAFGISILSSCLVETFNNKVTEIENLLNSNSNTFVVLTNPEIHQNTIGLSYEYNEGPKYTEATEEKPASIELPDTIHILELGRVDLDFDYLIKSHQETAENIVKNVINKEEYLPDFFRSPYRSIIGKQIYIKGSSSGELTIIPEEAYLGYNNIIKIGFIADAWINGNSISTIKPLLDKVLSEKYLIELFACENKILYLCIVLKRHLQYAAQTTSNARQ